MANGQWSKLTGWLNREVYALFLALQDPRVPWYAKAWVIFVVLYLLSPVDLVPDVLPFAGWLDDLILVPLGFRAASLLLPPQVKAEVEQRAAVEGGKFKRILWIIAVVLLLWIGIIVLAAVYLVSRLSGRG